ncbi:MAG: hypothetical protein ACI4SN_00910 [Lachnospiraceae bacterium]
MNHVNWVQQEQNTEYHVIQWKNSEFHNHHVRKDRAPEGGMGPFSVAKVVDGSGAVSQIRADVWGDERVSRPEESKIDGFGYGDILGSNSRTISGSGKEEVLPNGAKRNDEVTLSSEGVVAGAAVRIQTEPLAEEVSVETDTSAESVETISGFGQGGLRNRLKDSAKRLQEIYQEQKKKLMKMPAGKVKQEEKKDRRQAGTRLASKEEMWSMQAENHYLLDSYDKNGNRSILGK